MNSFTGWVMGYLVNALWQVPVVFAAGWVAARFVRRCGPGLEHRVWVGALLLEVVLPGCQVGLGGMLRAGLGWLGHGGAAAGGEVRVAMGAGAVMDHGLLRLPAAARAALFVVYGSALLYFAVRLAWGLWKTTVLARGAERVLLTGAETQEWERMARAFGCEGTELAESPGVCGPVTVGWWRGMVLVPPGFLTRVAREDWDAVMAHEFAHIVRLDFLKNVVYEVVTLPLAWHPAVWLTRARLAESRKMVCDAMAAEAGAGFDRGGYARSLLRLASLLAKGTPERTLHAIGIFDANLFERRVMRLTEKRLEMRGVRRAAMAVACMLMGVMTCGSALALRMEVPVPSAQETAASHGPARVSGGVMAGQVLTQVNPVYPPDAKAAKITGAVVMKAVIGKDGVVENLQVVSGPEELRKSALDAVRQWTYKPYLRNGEPTEVETTITVTYSLSQ